MGCPLQKLGKKKSFTLSLRLLFALTLILLILTSIFSLALFYLLYFLSIYYPYKHSFIFLLISTYSLTSRILTPAHTRVSVFSFSSSSISCSFFLPSLISNKRVALYTQTDHKYVHKIILRGISFGINCEGVNILSYIRQVSITADYVKLYKEMQHFLVS